MRKNISPTLFGVRTHPLVERAAVNRVVVGSSPTRGAKKEWSVSVSEAGCFFISQRNLQK